ncbi:replication-associated recombination protein A [Hyphobacterium sp. CCMP332]|nr:replication-associated recombination protein A [Hyphobacterium sp. CCMP332]
MLTQRIPLAERLRPVDLDTFIGQSHLLGNGAVLRKVIESGVLPSMILWGPPGVGKTSLANVIANTLKLPFHTLSAIAAGVKDVREVIEKAKRQGNAILFIDEIHRFNKGQQDALLGAVEKGTITLIGATTENPSFEVINALLSRCQIYLLKQLEEKDLKTLANYAIERDIEIKQSGISIKEWDALFRIANGDGRKLLNIIELVSQNLDENKEVTNKLVQQIAQQKQIQYDKNGDLHYDIISAFIKSIRGSDPNAGVYWLARMIEGGEDPKFIARRLLILASEDIGNANPTALVLANACFDAVNKIGWPESRIILSQCVTYLASSPKSNAAYKAIAKAQEEVRNSGNLSVPLPIRNAPTKLMKDQGYGLNYKYAHDFEGNFVLQEYLPDEIKDNIFYEPGKNKREADLRAYLKSKWQGKYNY